jgi:hypothetical protein
MNESEAIQRSGMGPKFMDEGMREQEDLWRRAEDSSMPLSEKIGHALFAAFVLALYILGPKESPPFTIMFLWAISFASSRSLRQQKQIDALCELLRQAAARR